MLMTNLTMLKLDTLADAPWSRLNRLETLTFALMPHRSDPTVEMAAKTHLTTQFYWFNHRGLLSFDTKVSHLVFLAQSLLTFEDRSLSGIKDRRLFIPSLAFTYHHMHSVHPTRYLAVYSNQFNMLKFTSEHMPTGSALSPNTKTWTCCTSNLPRATSIRPPGPGGIPTSPVVLDSVVRYS